MLTSLQNQYIHRPRSDFKIYANKCQLARVFIFQERIGGRRLVVNWIRQPENEGQHGHFWENNHPHLDLYIL